MFSFLRKWFSRKTPEAEVETRPLSLEEIRVSHQMALLPRREIGQLVAACGQSVGRQRELNEDSLLTFTSTIAGNKSNSAFGLYIVADGMGGHQFGEIASNLAVRVVASTILRKLFTSFLDVNPKAPDQSLREIIEQAFAEAQRTIQREAPGSGTTLTVAVVIEQQVTVGHVGDSRAYLLHPGGHHEVMTRDHSLVKRLEELGHITPEEAASYPNRNVLYRAVGQGDSLDADIYTFSLAPNDYLMLCSDGLWGVVPDEKIARIIRESTTLDQACQRLVDAANEAGGPDNISVILVRWVG